MVTRSKMFFFLSVGLVLLVRTSLCLGDTLASGESLSADQTLISKGSVFELGFFTLGVSPKIYVGIWYKKQWPQIFVWIANRDKPLTNSASSRLIISEVGNLQLMESEIQVWSTNMSSKMGNSTVAVLLDNGNLVLRDRPQSSGFIWQSFDHQTALVPGAKLRFNKQTKASQPITAWKSLSNPGAGMFSLGIDPDGSQIYLEWNKSQRYWTSGAWNGKFFSQLPEMNEMRIKDTFNFSFVSNENETFFTYSVHDTSMNSVLAIDPAGDFRLLTYLKGVPKVHGPWPMQKCEIYGVCGPFSICLQRDTIACGCLDGFEPRFQPNLAQVDWSKGCERRKPLQCENETSNDMKEDGFLLQSKIRLPANAQPSTVSSAQQCKLACLNNCSCTAYTYDNGKCLIWNGELFNLKQFNAIHGNDLYVKVDASEIPRHKAEAKAKKLVWLIVALPTILAMLILCLFICYMRKRRLKPTGESETHQDLLLFDLGTSNEDNDGSFTDKGNLHKEEKQDVKLPLFSFSSVLVATDNFSAENKLGEGGFGPVYKGKLRGGHEVALKRLSRQSGQGLIEFRNEMLLIAQLQHRNLVRLLGCCVERDEKILIYEYMPYKSLDSLLFDPMGRQLLDWERRVHIIAGIAQGLIYLHEYSRLRIIHRDLKASNILLDGNMNPKISDFGMARIFGGNNSQANTNRIVGTYGYMSPEYAMEGLFSVKSDVFSFGVLMIEILSGKKNTGFYDPDSINLLGHAWELWKTGRGLELIDPILSNPPLTPLTLRYIKVALLCVQESPTNRPTMPEVFSMFSNESAALPLPKQPAFSIGRREMDANSQRSWPRKFSVNDLTITMEAR